VFRKEIFSRKGGPCSSVENEKLKVLGLINHTVYFGKKQQLPSWNLCEEASVGHIAMGSSWWRDLLRRLLWGTSVGSL
jgi:hypothetical protein